MAEATFCWRMLPKPKDILQCHFWNRATAFSKFGSKYVQKICFLCIGKCVREISLLLLRHSNAQKSELLCTYKYKRQQDAFHINGIHWDKSWGGNLKLSCCLLVCIFSASTVRKKEVASSFGKDVRIVKSWSSYPDMNMTNPTAISLHYISLIVTWSVINTL